MGASNYALYIGRYYPTVEDLRLSFPRQKVFMIITD
jgi:hypothetical protein